MTLPSPHLWGPTGPARYVVHSLLVLLPSLPGLALSQPSSSAGDGGGMPASTVILATPGAVGSPMSVEQLVARVLESQPDIRAAAQAIDSAQAVVLSSRALPNPRIEWNAGQSKPFATGSAGSAQSIALAQAVENPRLRDARRTVAEAGLDIARHQRQILLNNVHALVRTLVSELDYRQQEAQHFSESLTLLEQVRERVRRRVEVGEAPRYDLIKADAEIVTARQRSRQATLMIDRVRLAVERLAAGSLPPGWAVQTPGATELAAIELPAVAELTPDLNPELRVLQHRMAQAQREVDLARASVVSSVDLLVSRSREPDLSKNTVGISVSLPILDQRQGPIAQAQAEAARARTLLEGRRAELVQELLMARKALEMSLSRVRGLSQGALREAEAAVRVAEAAWQFGERGILDVLDAQRVLRSLRADLIQARFEAYSALIEIDRLAGRYREPVH